MRFDNLREPPIIILSFTLKKTVNGRSRWSPGTEERQKQPELPTERKATGCELSTVAHHRSRPGVERVKGFKTLTGYGVARYREHSSNPIELTYGE